MNVKSRRKHNFDKDDNIIFGINLKSIDKFKSQDNTAEYFLKLKE